MNQETIKLYIFGSRGSYPVSGEDFYEYGGQTCCYIIKRGDYALVIDCGSGLADARYVLAGCNKIDMVLTHVHYDHISGLLAWTVLPKGAKIRFFGTFSKWLGKDTIKEYFRAPFWSVQPGLGEMTELRQDGSSTEIIDGVAVRAYPSPHPNNASILLFEIWGRKINVMCDCERSDAISEDFIRDSDILLYDGMFDDSNYLGHEGWGHSTWQEGCRLATRVRPKKLYITHHASTSTDEMLRLYEKEARKIYPETYFARAGEVIEL